MSTSAPLGHRRPGHRAKQPSAAGSERISRDVGWAWGLIALTLPATLLAVMLVGILESLAGNALAWSEGVVYVAAMAPLLASIVVGLRVWRREGETLGLRAAFLSALVGVACTVMALMS